MASCKDCINYDVCSTKGANCDRGNNCVMFKDRTRFVELPCKVGDTVYIINGFLEIEEFKIEYFVIESSNISVGMIDDGEYDINELFFSKKEAERALKNENRIVE